MSVHVVRFHEDAITEAQAAHEWYASHSPQAAHSFTLELDRAIEKIGNAPQRWSLYQFGARRFLLRRFPFYIVYRVARDEIEVIAVAHARRRPGYWRAR